MIPFAVLFGLGLYLCRETFVRGHTAHMNSMHGFWIAIGRWADGAWFRPSWWPHWDAGMPFEFTYPPLVPALASLTGFHAVNGLVFCLGPATLYLWAARWSGSRGYAFAAAAVYMFASPSQLLVPDASFAWSHLWDARRIYTSFVWDETPHYAALAILPLALMAADRAVRTGGGIAFGAAALASAAMLLANAFGATMLALAWLCQAPAAEPGTRLRGWILPPLAGVAALLLAAPWLPPSLWLAILRNARAMPESRWTAESWLALAAVAAGAAALHLLLRRAEPVLRFAACFAWIAGTVAALHRYLDWRFLPQPGRYLIEFDWGMAVVAVFAVRPLLDRGPRTLRAAVCLALLVAAYPRVIEHRRYLKAFLAEKPVEETIEYRAARWLEDHLPGRRVMLAGSMAQWANAFTRVPQFRGGSYPAAFNPVQQQASEAAMWLADWNEGEAWYKAFAVEAVAVPGSGSPEFWKPFPHPEAFHRLPLLWSERDTAIYATGGGPLARVAPVPAFVERPEASSVRRFAAALRPAKFEWLDSNRARVQAEPGAGEAISVAVNYHPGWKAYMGGEPLEVRADGLGLIRLEPRGAGVVELRYDGGTEAKAAPLVAALTAAAIGFAAFAVRSSSGRTSRAAGHRGS